MRQDLSAALAEREAELAEARRQQLATAEILRVISQTPTDPQPVFERIVVTAARALRCDMAVMLVRDGDVYVHRAAATSEGLVADFAPERFPIDASVNFPSRAFLAKTMLHLPDWSQIDLPKHERWIHETFGITSALYWPLLRGDECIGVLVFAGARPNSFGTSEIAHAESFRDQAVIAMENARLFNETRVALERQTATADILKVIASSPSDVQPVFKAIAASANRLLGGFSTTVIRFIGDALHLVAFTPTNLVADKALQAAFPRPIGQFPPFTLVREGETQQFVDTEAKIGVPPLITELARLRGYRSMLFTPLMSDDDAIGMISVTRKEPGTFAADDVQLLQTFADQAVIAIRNARLFNETQAKTRDLEEALEHQTAASEVLSAISRSPTEVQPVFDAIARSATELCGATSGGVDILDHGLIRLVAYYNWLPEALEAMRQIYPAPPSRGFASARAILTRSVVHIPDISQDPEYTATPVIEVGFRSVLAVPMVRDGQPIGAIALVRLEPHPFSDRQIALLQTFAEQAVIAINNVRLFDEVQAKTYDLEEALEQQKATADVLKVINRSAFDLDAVFDALLASAVSLVGGTGGTICVRDGDVFRYRAVAEGRGSAIWRYISEHPAMPGRASVAGRVLLSGKPETISDTLSDRELKAPLHSLTGARSVVGVPLLRDHRVEGALMVARAEAGPFDSQQIDVLQTFADQAVIAIENVRLFRETQEALRQQTATSDILRVIASSPNDLQPVLDKIVETACRLCSAYDAVVLLREGDQLRIVAHHGPIPITFVSQQISRGWASGRAVVERRTVHIDDIAEHADEYPVAAALASRGVTAGSGKMLWRANLVVPLMREGEAIGVIGLRRAEAVPFSEGQIDLLKTFSDQAVIAIENARLFDEVQAKTRDLEESLQQQTATANVLKVISRSAFHLDAVLKTLTDSARSLSGAATAAVFLRDGETLVVRAESGCNPQFLEYLAEHPPRSGRETFTGRVLMTAEAAHIPDVLADPDYAYGAGPRLGNYRSGVGVPLLREGRVDGVFGLMHPEPRAFTPRVIELLKTFADQAVIAVENARLFDEVQAKTRDLEESLQQQTATADVLKVISRSAFDLQAVLHTLVESAAKLCDADKATITREINGVYYRAESYGFSEEFMGQVRNIPVVPERGSISGRAMLEGKPIQVEDVEADPEYWPVNFAKPGELRTGLGIPMMRNGAPIGVLALMRTEVRTFNDKQIELVQTFADQAVIAIENARLFDEVQAKTRDLEESLQQQTATADVLKVISRSAFDLQAVFDALISSAVKLIGAAHGTIYVRDGETFRIRAHFGVSERFADFLVKNPPAPGMGSASGRVMLTGKVVVIPDILEDKDYAHPANELNRTRSMLAVPLLRNDRVEGVLVIAQTEPGAFSSRQIELVQTFADQAVIAIENARLFDEVQAKTRDLQESLEQQTASAEILRVISSSPTDVQPVFDAIAHSAAILCEATNGTVFRLQDGLIHLVGYYSLSQAQLASVQHSFPAPLDRGTASGRAILECGVVHIRDIAADPEYSAHSLVKTGLRSVLAVPMLRVSEPIGSINVSREAVRPFSERQIELLKTFADQAVIAINNVGLFNETREALEQQKATADVLKVISRSAFDLDAVLQTLTHSARSLSGAASADVEMLDGDVLRIRAQSGCDPELVKYTEAHPLKRGTETVAGRVLMTGEAVHIPDVLADPDYDFGEGPRIGNYRALLGAPLIRDGKVDGVFTLMRPEPGAFTPRQIEIVQTFADQAVIAIENARLFDEVQARTRDLTEALQQQTATADVLKVISRSAFDLQAVLTTLAESARELCGASFVTLFMRDRDEMRLRAESGCTPEIVAFLHAHPIKASRETFTGRVMLSGETVHMPDVLADPEYDFGDAPRIGNYRALLGVPLLRNGQVEGVFALARPEPAPYTARQIEMVRAFADQAVIAIENSRLFEEVQARTRELAASLDDLRKAQDRLIQSEKLASLGQLTAGIAHEIKNPLNFINNYSALSRELVDELAEAIKGDAVNETVGREADELIGAIGGNLDKIVQHGKRADSIVKNMLLHSREGSGERSTTNVNAMLEEALNLAYHGARAEKPGFNVTIVKSLDPNAGAAEVYAQEMTRVLLNLISNGFYATTKRKQNVGDAAYEPTIAASTRDLGPKVEIAIRDNGIGISDEVKAKMFNPFFTTKPAGEGTGLGLSLSHDIVVKQHGGTIEVLTEPDAFTQFTIVLPRGTAGL